MTRESRRPLRGIFFDLDDTLIGYSEAERNALAAGCRLAAQINPAIRERALAAAIYEIYARRFSYGTEGYAQLATMTVSEFRFVVTGEALRLFGVDDLALIGAMVDVYEIAERSALRAFPDAMETLTLLRPHFRLGLITNGPSAMQREKLAVLALDGCFEEIIVDTEFGHPKPDRRIFDHAARRVGLTAPEMMFVGNSLEADIVGARAADWTSVWYNPSGETLPANAPEPDFQIRTIADLPLLEPVARVLDAAAHRTIRTAAAL